MLGMSSAFAYYPDEPMTHAEFDEAMNKYEAEANHSYEINNHLNDIKGRVYQ